MIGPAAAREHFDGLPEDFHRILYISKVFRASGVMMLDDQDHRMRYDLLPL